MEGALFSPPQDKEVRGSQSGLSPAPDSIFSWGGGVTLGWGAGVHPSPSSGEQRGLSCVVEGTLCGSLRDPDWATHRSLALPSAVLIKLRLQSAINYAHRLALPRSLAPKSRHLSEVGLLLYKRKGGSQVFLLYMESDLPCKTKQNEKQDCICLSFVCWRMGPGDRLSLSWEMD